MSAIGIESGELLRLINQIGVVLVASSSLWGLFFSFKRTKGSGYEEITRKLFGLLFVSFLVVGASWLAISYWKPFELLAHEGIALSSSHNQIDAARMGKASLMATLAVVVLAGGFLWCLHRRHFYIVLPFFYGATFLFALILSSIPAWTGEPFSIEQLFYYSRFHSIMTLGTVICLDYLFHISETNESVRRALYPHFDTMSKVIWTGLGIDFLSVMLIFPDALTLTPKFYFAQTVVAILIINGVLLSGPLTKKCVALMRSDGIALPLSGGWGIVAGISGVISIVSWSTITVIDAFANLNFNYYGLALAYATVILLGWTVYFVLLRRHPMTSA